MLFFFRKTNTNGMFGPVSVDQLKNELIKQNITDYDVEIWDGNLIAEWKKISDIPPLLAYLNASNINNKNNISSNNNNNSDNQDNKIDNVEIKEEEDDNNKDSQGKKLPKPPKKLAKSPKVEDKNDVKNKSPDAQMSTETKSSGGCCVIL